MVNNLCKELSAASEGRIEHRGMCIVSHYLHYGVVSPNADTFVQLFVLLIFL